VNGVDVLGNASPSVHQLGRPPNGDDLNGQRSLEQHLCVHETGSTIKRATEAPVRPQKSDKRSKPGKPQASHDSDRQDCVASRPSVNHDHNGHAAKVAAAPAKMPAATALSQRA
jgi:hypothetical protein